VDNFCYLGKKVVVLTVTCSGFDRK